MPINTKVGRCVQNIPLVNQLQFVKNPRNKVIRLEKKTITPRS